MDKLLKNEIVKRVVSGSILCFCFFGAYLHSPLLFSFILLACLMVMLYFEWSKLIVIRGYKFWLLSFLYPILPMLNLIFLNHWYRNQDILFPLYPFIVAWVGDTAAFTFGKLWGKHKICPTISPGKSWEGLLGAFVGIMIFNILYLPGITVFPFTAYLQGPGMIALLSFLLTIVAFLGDIFESFLKRKREIKDSGTLLPGHGGLMDKFDSVSFISILVLLLIVASHIM
jgi:phosphatidate cytidylyltransferase